MAIVDSVTLLHPAYSTRLNPALCRSRTGGRRRRWMKAYESDSVRAETDVVAGVKVVRVEVVMLYSADDERQTRLFLSRPLHHTHR